MMKGDLNEGEWVNTKDLSLSFCVFLWFFLSMLSSFLHGAFDVFLLCQTFDNKAAILCEKCGHNPAFRMTKLTEYENVWYLIAIMFPSNIRSIKIIHDATRASQT